jgi:hypothetical protein
MRKLAGDAINWDDYTSHWFMLPKSMNCPFGGLGAVGWDYIWIPNSEGLGISVGIWAHELGHNLGMNHASARYNGVLYEYEDFTVIMGGNDACFNLANRETVGWEEPALTINVSTLTRGMWTDFTIKASGTTQNTGLKIVTRYKTNADSAYIEFRKAGQLWFDFVCSQTARAGGDEMLDTELTGANFFVYPNPQPDASGQSYLRQTLLGSTSE